MTLTRWVFFCVVLFIAGMLLDTALSILGGALLIVAVVLIGAWKGWRQ